MFSIEEFIIAVCGCVDDLLNEITQGQPLRVQGFARNLAGFPSPLVEVVSQLGSSL